jgi:hypothetical protein
MTNVVKVIYIGGYSRSGTTLLLRLLARAQRTVAVGELTEVWERSYLGNQLCGCGKPFLECDFWDAVSMKTFGCVSAAVPAGDLQQHREQVMGYRHIPQLAFPALSRGEHRRARDDYRDMLSRLYHAISEVSDAGIVIDSSKVPHYAWVLAGAPRVDLHLVHLVRDSRANAFSWRRHKRRTEIHWTQQEMERYSLLRSSLEWDAFNLSLSLRRRLAHSYTVLRYEDLVRDPDGCLSRLATVLDLDLSEPVGDHVELQVSHTTAGNPSRFETGTVSIVPDEAWRTEMPGRDRTMVTMLTAPGLKYYGYPLRGSRLPALHEGPVRR